MSNSETAVAVRLREIITRIDQLMIIASETELNQIVADSNILFPGLARFVIKVLVDQIKSSW